MASTECLEIRVSVASLECLEHLASLVGRAREETMASRADLVHKEGEVTQDLVEARAWMESPDHQDCKAPMVTTVCLEPRASWETKVCLA